MKPPYTKFIAFLVLSVLLYSCSSSRFTSRKYGNRDWIKVEHQPYEQPVGSVHSTPVQEENSDPVKIEHSPEIKTELVKNEIIRSNELPKISEPVKEEEIAENNSPKKTTVKKKNTISGRLALVDPPVGSFTKKLAELSDPFTSVNSTSEVDQIVIVLLAILLPPLGVYLYDGASTMFWITLILCLLGGPLTIFRSYIFGLYGVAVILAVLYVLGII